MEISLDIPKECLEGVESTDEMDRTHLNGQSSCLCFLLNFSLTHVGSFVFLPSLFGFTPASSPMELIASRRNPRQFLN